MSAIVTIDLHGYDSERARLKLTTGLNNAFNYGERVVRIIHGQGKHSEVFPVIKSLVRHWLEESELAKEIVESVFRGEDGSPYTAPNPGETIVVLKSLDNNFEPQLSYDVEEEREARRNFKKIRAAKRHSTRRRY